MQKPTKRQRRLAAKYRRMVKAQDRAAAQYELADRLAFQIAAKAKPDEIIPISETKGIKAIDQARAAIEHPKRKPDQMPKIWAHAAARLVSIEEVKLTAE